MTTAFDRALTEWAEDLGCTEIDLDQSNAFAKVWMYSIICALMVTICIAVPQCLCREAARDEDGEETIQAPEDAEVAACGTFDDPKPDKAKARLYLWKTSATDLSAGRHKWRSVLFTPIHDLGKVGGPGTELYFRFLRSLGYCFAYMFALSIPLLAFSLPGDFAPDTGNQLVKTSLGNIGRVSIASGLHPMERLVIIDCQGIPVSVITKYVGWLDFGATLLFLTYACYVRFVLVPKVQRESNEAQLTPQDFSVVIDCLPARLADDDHQNYKTMLADFVQERVLAAREAAAKDFCCWKGLEVTTAPAAVNEVTLVRDYHQNFSKVLQLEELKRQKDIVEYKKEQGLDEKAEKKIEKLDKKIQKLHDKIGDKVNQQSLDVVRAFVILNTEEDVEHLLRAYRFGNFPLGRCYQKHKFQGKGIRIRRAPEPDNILWENQDLEFHWRFVRRAVILLLFLVVMAISLFIIYGLSRAAKAQTNSTQPVLNISECDAVHPGSGSSEPVCSVAMFTNWTIADVALQSDDDRHCWCSSQGAQKIFEDSAVQDLCEDWLTEVAKANALIGVASIGVVIINFVVETLLLAMAAFERPLSLSELQASMMFKISVAQIINTSLIVSLVDWAAPEGLRYEGGGVPLGSGNYNDLVRGWYSTVGATVLLNMLLNMVVPNGAKIGKMVFYRFLRWFFARGAQHQAELLAVYQNPDWEISANFAKVLTTIFCTMLYSSGLPLLYFFAAIFMFLSYWADKVVLLRGSKRPPAYDTTMPKQAANTLMYACFLHSVMGVAMLGQPCVSPSDELGGDALGGTMADLQSQASGIQETDGLMDSVRDRVSRESTWLLFSLCLVLMGLWALWLLSWIFGGSLSSLWKCLSSICRSRSTKVAPDPESEGDEPSQSLQDGPTTWDTAKDIINAKHPPASYSMREHPEFKLIANADAFQTFKTTDADWSFLQKRGDPEPREPEEPSAAEDAVGDE